jgi:hypothetical protein
MTAHTSAVRAARALLCLTVLLAAGAALAAHAPESLAVPAGTRIGVVNLLDPEVTHFHAARQVQDSFLKTYTMDWPVGALLLGAVADRLKQLGLSTVAVEASDELHRAREACFLNASLAKGLPKDCTRIYAQLGAAQQLGALIVLGPGRNDGAHAGGTRHRELPEYLRGWCFVSGQGGAGEAPTLLSLTELLLIAVTPGGAELAARQWGGNGHSWSGYQAPQDLKALSDAQLQQLRPLYAAMLKERADALLTHLEVKP